LEEKMDKSEIQRKIAEEVDYIRCPKCSNSLTKFLAKNPEGVDNTVIARLLAIPEEKVEELYQESVEKLRERMVNEDEQDE
jgi:hypothetical protein